MVFLHVKDHELMAKWYQETLGIDLDFATPDKSWQEFSLEESRPPTRFALDCSQHKRSEIEEQPIMVSFKVEDIHSMVQSLESKGIELYGTPTIKEEGPSLFVTFQNPEGNWIQVSQQK